MPYTNPRILCGNCIDIGAQLLGSGERFDLVFGDPPFNIGQGYSGHDDQMSAAEYERFTCDWLGVGSRLLTPNGLLAVHVPDRVAVMVIRHLTAMQLRHWCQWHYRFGQACSVASAKKCTTSKEHLLVWGRGANQSSFNPPIVASDRATKYGDKRTQQTATPGQRVAFDVWGLDCDGPYWGRIQGNNAERWCRAKGAPADHPNQLPERYMQRVIETFTNPGDRVLVMFGGSGTETVVAHALGRNVVSIEKSAECCRSIAARLRKGPVRVPQCSAAAVA